MAWLNAAAVSIVALVGAHGGGILPEWDGALPPPESVKGGVLLCNFAAVHSARRVEVRAGPGPQYKVIGALRPGRTVFVCNEYNEHGRHWLGVVFRANTLPCDGGTEKGLDIRLSRHCQSGWVPDAAIGVLSG